MAEEEKSIKLDCIRHAKSSLVQCSYSAGVQRLSTDIVRRKGNDDRILLLDQFVLYTGDGKYVWMFLRQIK